MKITNTVAMDSSGHYWLTEAGDAAVERERQINPMTFGELVPRPKAAKAASTRRDKQYRDALAALGRAETRMARAFTQWRKLREYIAACKHLEDAAAIVCCHASGATIRDGHAKSCTLYAQAAEETPRTAEYHKGISEMCRARLAKRQYALDSKRCCKCFRPRAYSGDYASDTGKPACIGCGTLWPEALS